MKINISKRTIKKLRLNAAMMVWLTVAVWTIGSFVGAMIELDPAYIYKAGLFDLVAIVIATKIYPALTCEAVEVFILRPTKQRRKKVSKKRGVG